MCIIAAVTTISYFLTELSDFIMHVSRRVHPRTQCDVIMALSDQITLMATLQERFITFISKCLSSSNSIVNLISHLAITNPLSSAGKNYRSVIDSDGELNNSHSIIK